MEEVSEAILLRSGPRPPLLLRSSASLLKLGGLRRAAASHFLLASSMGDRNCGGGYFSSATMVGSTVRSATPASTTDGCDGGCGERGCCGCVGVAPKSTQALASKAAGGGGVGRGAEDGGGSTPGPARRRLLPPLPGPPLAMRSEDIEIFFRRSASLLPEEPKAVAAAEGSG